MISKCILRNSVQDSLSQKVFKRNPNTEEPKREEKVVNKEKKNKRKIEKEIGRTYQFRPSKESKGNPKK